eukprot:SAG22_NODE_1189_length_5206_cov_14.857451_4_plen_387_part_00
MTKPQSEPPTAPSRAITGGPARERKERDGRQSARSDRAPSKAKPSRSERVQHGADFPSSRGWCGSGMMGMMRRGSGGGGGGAARTGAEGRVEPGDRTGAEHNHDRDKPLDEHRRLADLLLRHRRRRLLRLWLRLLHGRRRGRVLELFAVGAKQRLIRVGLDRLGGVALAAAAALAAAEGGLIADLEQGVAAGPAQGRVAAADRRDHKGLAEPDESVLPPDWTEGGGDDMRRERTNGCRHVSSLALSLSCRHRGSGRERQQAGGEGGGKEEAGRRGGAPRTARHGHAPARRRARCCRRRRSRRAGSRRPRPQRRAAGCLRAGRAGPGGQWAGGRAGHRDMARTSQPVSQSVRGNTHTYTHTHTEAELPLTSSWGRAGGGGGGWRGTN